MIMPFVNLSKIEKIYQRAIMEALIDNNKMLLMCPPYYSSVRNKLIHNEILKLLNKDKRWCVPVSYAWNMPHVAYDISNKLLSNAKMNALLITVSGCFYGNEIQRGVN